MEYLDVPNNLENEALGTRKVPFCRELYIERDDFMEEPPKKYFRLFPGNEVRLMSAYFVKCESFVKDENGNVVEVHCTYDPETKSGSGFTGRKVKGTIHWVAAPYAQKAEVRLYENLVDEEKGVYNRRRRFSESEPEFSDGAERVLCGAEFCRCESIRQFPVCENRIFLYRCKRFRTGRACI